jgi:hypothetical protein
VSAERCWCTRARVECGHAPKDTRKGWHERARALVADLRALMLDVRPASAKAVEYERLLVDASELLEAG